MMPRLVTVVVFPSFGPVLVSTSTRGRSPFRLENKIEVRAVRNDSASGELLWQNEIISTPESSRAMLDGLLALSARLRDFGPVLAFADPSRSPSGTTPSSETP